MKISRFSRRVIQIIIFICILILPLFLISKFHNSLLIKQIEESSSMKSSDLLSCAIDYLSLVVALLLGIVAYYQTKAVNELEYLKYSVFIGIEKLDYSYSHQKPFEWKNYKSDCTIAQSLSYQEKTLCAYVNMITSPSTFGSGKLIHIPLVFVTKNEPLIVSVEIRTINVNLLHNNEPIARKTFRENENVYHTILNDGDHFNISLGIIANDTATISTIELTFDIILEDHHGRKHSMLAQATLSNQADGLYLTSSHTKRLAV